MHLKYISYEIILKAQVQVRKRVTRKRDECEKNCGNLIDKKSIKWIDRKYKWFAIDWHFSLQ
jgi:hypothetical protein